MLFFIECSVLLLTKGGMGGGAGSQSEDDSDNNKKVSVLCLQSGGVEPDNGPCVLVALSQTFLMWPSIVDQRSCFEEFVLHDVGKKKKVSQIHIAGSSTLNEMTRIRTWLVSCLVFEVDGAAAGQWTQQQETKQNLNQQRKVFSQNISRSVDAVREQLSWKAAGAAWENQKVLIWQNITSK